MRRNLFSLMLVAGVACPGEVAAAEPMERLNVEIDTHFVKAGRVAIEAEKSELDAKSAEIVQRMKAIRLPEMAFAPPKTIVDAIEFFRVASKKYDSTEIPEEKRGFNFVLRTNPEVSAPTIPMIKASDISFYDALKLVCECIDYTFEVLPGPVVVVMSKENYAQTKEDMKKAEIVERMKAMRLPEVTFESSKTMVDAFKFFCEASKKYDSAETPVEKRGFNMILQTRGADAPVIPMLKLRDVSFYDALKFVCARVDYTFEINYASDLSDVVVTIKPCDSSAKCDSGAK